MKKRIMKLSVLLGVPVIALFMMVGMASADPSYSIQGVYAVTGFSTCYSAPGANAANVLEADYTFSHDGYGAMKGVIRHFGGDSPSFALSADFKYTVTKEGRIKFDYSDLGGLKIGAVLSWDEDLNPLDVFPVMALSTGPSHGVISPDGKTITISCGPPVVLHRLDSDGKPIVGSDMYCITSSTGMRIK